jgi:hypothetical protein
MRAAETADLAHARQCVKNAEGRALKIKEQADRDVLSLARETLKLYERLQREDKLIR